MVEASIVRSFIDGGLVEERREGLVKDVNPSDTRDTLCLVQPGSREDVKYALEAAEGSFQEWGCVPAPRRGEILLKTAQILESEKDELATILAREMGKNIKDARAEVNRSISIFTFYGVLASRIRGESLPSRRDRTHVFVMRYPIGVVAIITPWNFPIAIPSWKIAPALACGNTVVFKPSSYTPLIGYKLVEALHKAGLPRGVLNFVVGSGSTVGDELVSNKVIKAVSFTGSNEVGTSIRKKVSQLEQNVRIQLEMGGKNPLIIMDDADLDKAVEYAAVGSYKEAGQSCTATGRIIVHEKIVDRFVPRFVERAKKVRVGNALREDCDIGPVVSEKEMEKILGFIESGISEGAKLLYGGRRLTDGDYSHGYFIQPTILTDVKPDMRIAQEEIFGPVAPIITVSSFEEALEIANNSRYGLSAALLTRNVSRIFEFIDRVEAGVIKINHSTRTVELQAPFGGVKGSSSETIKEMSETVIDFYTKTKSVYITY